MSIGSILVGAGLLWLSFTVVLRPWRTHSDGAWESQRLRGDDQGASGNVRSITSLTARRDSIYSALADLEFDRSIGKLNDDDYQVVRSQLMAQAVEVLKQIDTASASTAQIESDVEALVRARRGAASSPTSRVQSGALLGSMNVYCTGCGSALKPDDHFCGKCGRPVANRCPHCDAAVGAGDAFCIRCGTRLLAAAAA